MFFAIFEATNIVQLNDIIKAITNLPIDDNIALGICNTLSYNIGFKYNKSVHNVINYRTNKA